MTVDGFWMQRHQVTNAQYAAFVDATGYVTVAERPPNAADYPDAPPENLQPGSMVFHRTPGPVDLRHINQWWTWTPGACWNHPRGPKSSLRNRDAPSRRPRRVRRRRGVRGVGRAGAAHRGAVGGGRTRRAARSHLHVGRRTGTPRAATGQLLARRVPLPARHGLRDHAAGRLASPPTATACSTWRATSGSGRRDWWADDRTVESCCAADSYDPNQPQFQIGRKVIKGGSFLCADSYCLRYRPAARRPQMVDTGMSHIGFRCIRR